MASTLTIVHISDLHLGPLAGLPWRSFNVKRGLGWLNWHKSRRRVHWVETAHALAADIAALKPDHVVVSGDLANVGLAREHERGLKFLQQLGPPDKVTVVPGNHDIYSGNDGESCLKLWAPYFTGDSGRAEFPFVRRVGPVAFIGLNSAVPTPPFVASGKVGAKQRAALGPLLDDLKAEGLLRVVVIHHPPLPGQAPLRRALRDAEAVTEVIRQHGAELVLHGHNHCDMLEFIETPGCAIPVVGVASGSASRSRHEEPLARYNVIRIETQGNAPVIGIVSRGLTEAGGKIEDVAVIDLARCTQSARSS